MIRENVQEEQITGWENQTMFTRHSPPRVRGLANDRGGVYKPLTSHCSEKGTTRYILVWLGEIRHEA